MYFLFLAILIGIIIGVFTNYMAIKMLFHPYTAWKVWNFKVPFTPGLIPKRRGEIAEQLGHMVENYLFTPDGMKQFIETSNIKSELYNKLQEYLEEYKRKNKNFGEEISKLFQDDWHGKVKDFTGSKISQLLDNEEIRKKTLNEILSEETLNNIDDKIRELSKYSIKEIKRYILSKEGKRKIKTIVKQLLNANGMVGILASLLIDANQIQTKIIDYIEQTLNQQETRRSINRTLLNIWYKVKNEPIGVFIDKFDDVIKNEADLLLDKGVDYVGNLSTNKVISNFEKNNYIELIYNFILEFLIERLDKIFSALKIGKVVETEVNKFSIDYLEKLIIEVSGKELKMITLFGGILGGLIGLVQGLLYIFSGI